MLPTTTTTIDAPPKTTRPVLSAPHQLAQVRLASELVEDVWGFDVWIWELTGTELDLYRQGQIKTKGAKVTLDLRSNTARLLVYAIRNESGERLYSERDVPELLKLGASGLEKLATVARRLSGLDEDDEEAEMEGNFDGDLIASSPSPSPDTSDAPSPSS